MKLKQRSSNLAQRALEHDVGSFAAQLLGEARSRRSPAVDVATNDAYSQWLCEVSSRSLHEMQWDPAKHPRGGYSQNRGMFSPGWGPAAMGDNSQSPANLDSRNKRIPAQFAASTGVGHHWTPLGLIFRDDIHQFLSEEAVKYAMGNYSGATIDRHGYKTYGGVSHYVYNSKVSEELRAFIANNGIKKKQMTAAQMEQFSKLMENGLNAAGKPHHEIGAFSSAIKKLIPAHHKKLTKLNDIIAAGEKYMKGSRFKLLAAGAVATGLLWDALANQVKVLDVAAKSQHYRLAMEAFQDGNLSLARKHLIHDEQSLAVEIENKLGYIAASKFRKMVLDMLASVQQKQYT